jgi:hypothetical protein
MRKFQTYPLVFAGWLILAVVVSLTVCQPASAGPNSGPTQVIVTNTPLAVTVPTQYLPVGKDCINPPNGINKVPGADLERCPLVNANLSGANLSGAYLIGANLTGANLSDAILDRANLNGTNLAGANLFGASLGADTYGTNLFGANLTGIHWGTYTKCPDGKFIGASLNTCADDLEY